MAREHKGALLILAAVIKSTSGIQMLATKKKFRAEATVDNWILLLELLLQWDAHLCEAVMKKDHVKRLEKNH